MAEEAPDDPRVLVAQGTLLLARHRFADGLAVGRRALEVAPGNEAAYGVVVDASNELGRYDEAAEATQHMVDVRPDLASLSRVSYARELHGDLDGAIAAMSQAVTATAGSSGENVAYVQVLLGNLLLTRGDLDEAVAAYDAAEQAFPDLPAATAGRAKVLVARGEYDRAADLLEELVEVQPLPEYAIALGDARSAAGDRAGAAEAYELVGVIADLYRANGVDVDLEIALFDADHGPSPATVAAARGRSRTGRASSATTRSRGTSTAPGRTRPRPKEMALALRTGSRDPLLRFHAAAIADAAGDRGAATEHLQVVLDSNPRFSAALADDVEQLAGELGLEVPCAGFLMSPRKSLMTGHPGPRSAPNSARGRETMQPPGHDRSGSETDIASRLRAHDPAGARRPLPVPRPPPERDRPSHGRGRTARRTTWCRRRSSSCGSTPTGSTRGGARSRRT